VRGAQLTQESAVEDILGGRFFRRLRQGADRPGGEVPCGWIHLDFPNDFEVDPPAGDAAGIWCAPILRRSRLDA